MIHVSATASIGCTPAEVFAYVADLRNFPRWRANLASSTIVSEHYTDVGATCDEEVQVGPAKIPGTCRITTFSAGHTFAFQAVSRGLTYDGRVVTEPDGNRTTFTLSGDITLSGFLRLLRPMIARSLQDGVRREVAAIKANLEETR